MSDTYLTIAHSAQSKIVIKKSSFLGFALPLTTESEALDIIRDFRKRFHDARHVCYAYILRTAASPAPSSSNATQTSSLHASSSSNSAQTSPLLASSSSLILKSSDGGEPTGTAGRPILGTIQSAGLENVMVVVVRYFGGILLGAPGLIAAYRQAAHEALDAAGTASRTEQQRFTISFPYSQMNSVMQILKQHSAKILSNQSGMECTLTVEAPPAIVTEIAPRIQKFATKFSFLVLC